MQIEVKKLGAPLQEISDKVRKRARTSATSELRKILVRETAPARQHVRAAALGTLPHAGGLNKRVAAMPRAILRVHKMGRMDEVEAIIRDTRKGTDLRRIDRGEVHHPFFGDRNIWYSQHVAPGFFTATLERERPIVQARVSESITQFMASINAPLGKELR